MHAWLYPAFTEPRLRIYSAILSNTSHPIMRKRSPALAIVDCLALDKTAWQMNTLSELQKGMLCQASSGRTRASCTEL